MSEFENDLQRLTFLKRTITLLSSMVYGGECHTARSKEMKSNAQQVILEMEANAVQTSDSGLHLQRVSGMSLSDYAQKKLEYINGSCIAREFPEHQPSKEWAGAVLDLLEDLKLGDYR